LKQRPISVAVGISEGSVCDYLRRARDAGLGWEEAKLLSEAEVEKRLFKYVGRSEPAERAPIDMEWVHREMHRPGVTLQRLWSEYVEGVASSGTKARPYQYSQFCELYAQHRKKLEPSMRQVHRAGEKAFLDYSGKKPVIIDPETGEVTEVDLFVMLMGASNYTYAEATYTQRLEDFVGSTVRGLEFFGCVPVMLVPDQLRSAVQRPDRYEPEINRTYAEMAQHYKLAIVPARPGKPKDKAKVEGAVLIVQRWILACLRNRTFFSLEELNAAIHELVERLNQKPFRKLEGCRRTAFETIDRPAMKPLPSRRYEIATWKDAKVNIDYHIEYEERYYSVPHALIGAKVSVRATRHVVEIFHGGERVASHRRCYGRKGTPETLDEHRPKSHREYGNWPPERLIGWGRSIGPSVGGVVESILAKLPHPEMGYRSCQALFRMKDRYGVERLEKACERAIQIGNPTRKSVEAILQRGVDRLPHVDDVALPAVAHDNIRGGQYYDKGETQQTSDDEIESKYLEEERLAIIEDGNRRLTTKGADDRIEEEANLGKVESMNDIRRNHQQAHRAQTSDNGQSPARVNGCAARPYTIV
jgi:transposase